MLKAVVTHQGASLVQVRVLRATDEVVAKSEEAGTATVVEQSPILPELKELAWGAGSFVVFALLMRFFLFPRLKSGMDARYGSIRANHESAEQLRATAQQEVGDYQSALAGVRAEAAARVDAVRETLEAERAEKLAAVNAGIASRKAVAAAEAETARLAVRSEIESAVGAVAARATELATGKVPAAAAVAQAVAHQMNVGAGR